MPLQETSGNVTTDAYGGGAAVIPNYIEDVFSTYLYTGNGSTQTITNGIDLSTKGGLVWVKGRNETYYHRLASSPGPTLPNYLASNATDAASSGNGNISAFSTSGFTANNNGGTGGTNSSGINYVSWTFRKQTKFFDVVTYTGTGSVRTVSHNLGSDPGMIFVKATSTTGNWAVYYGGIGSAAGYALLNSTAAATSNSTYWNSTYATSTQFTVGTNANTNANGVTYVAYLFANQAGGFGITGTDSVIACDSFNVSGTAGTYVTKTLGWEPQFILVKAMGDVGDWQIFDNMRGMSLTGDQVLLANSSGAETSIASTKYIYPTATGFMVNNGFGTSPQDPFYFIAIRRGPMKVPTSGTSVYNGTTYTGNGATGQTISTTNRPDAVFLKRSDSSADGFVFEDRLRGKEVLTPSSTAAALASTGDITAFLNASFSLGASNQGSTNDSGGTYISYPLTRAPSFFDEVCYTGTNANQTLNHNLGVTPELIIVKDRSQAQDWEVYSATAGATKALRLNQTVASFTATTYWNSTNPTSSVFTVGTSSDVNSNGNNYVAYLFATCAGVSKVGSYTGNGSTQTINCGFTGGARFVLIKRTDSTGNWYVYDTARGMTTLTDPYLLMNSTAAESATLGSVTSVSTGFAVNASILAAINTNAASYIFLAIA